ncbi:chloride channel protein [Deinococcus maricopensis]|uniref:Cl-channel voltage-gated family protein n=1 Tax=Deinococcus maricopensis (strain DSM 21211 / LMG 22137 / NRRL B-23946 / LB-34) TaxID=709986 RepID=E8U999_DEIML|nr:chloride channel protein [Deinococcus maricopensis]ADV67638.1 Cl- channel voltage-gated family protein [Deinococcus maricopensis DSM 21211]
MRSNLPRAVLTRLETGRLVVYALVAGVIVGVLGAGLRAAFGWLGPHVGQIIGYTPPGTPGEGGLLMAFSTGTPWGLLLLPVVAAACALLFPAAGGDSLAQLVNGYHTRGQWPRALDQVRTLAAAVLGSSAGLLIGRDAAFTSVGQLSARLLARLTRLDAVEFRTLTLASAGAALGLVLHAPLAAAVLIAEVLYRRFEFEFEVLMPCVLAAVAAYAVYGVIYNFDPLLSVNTLQPPTAAQVPAYTLLALGITFTAWAAMQVSRLLPDAILAGWWRVAAAFAFGAVTALIAWGTPEVLGGGAGWLQLSVSGFVADEGIGYGAWRWVLLALGVRLCFGGGVLPSVAIGGLLGAGLANAVPGLALDPVVAALVGAVAFLTVTINTPVGATLLATTWGGDAMLPAALAASAMAHALSGNLSLIPGQVRSRADSPVHQAATLPTEVLRDPSDVAIEGLPEPEGAEQLYRLAVPSAWAGARANVVAWPDGVTFVGVVRDGDVHLVADDEPLGAHDELVLLATPDAFRVLEANLSVQASPVTPTA